MIALPDDQVHLWWATASEADDPAIRDRQVAVLSDAERERLGRLPPGAARRSYVVSHALVRDALSRYAPVSPQAWAFATDAHGKPRIAAPQDGWGLEFNLSHAGPKAVVAVAHGRRVGVDVEDLGALGHAQAAAALVLAPREHRSVERDPRAMLDLWTLKEAYLKALGTGFSVPPSAVPISLDDPDRPRLAASDTVPAPEAWWLWRERTADHVAALAVQRGDRAGFDVVQRTIVPLADHASDVRPA